MCSWGNDILSHKKHTKVWKTYTFTRFWSVFWKSFINLAFWFWNSLYVVQLYIYTFITISKCSVQSYLLRKILYWYINGLIFSLSVLVLKKQSTSEYIHLLNWNKGLKWPFQYTIWMSMDETIFLHGFIQFAFVIMLFIEWNKFLRRDISVVIAFKCLLQVFCRYHSILIVIVKFSMDLAYNCSGEGIFDIVFTSYHSFIVL